MTIIDLVKLAGSNLWRRRMRTALTVLGVVIGTACIIVMITLGLENLRQTEESFKGFDMEIITVNTGESYGGMMMAGPGMSSSSSSGSELMTDITVEQFKAINGVKAVSPVINFDVTAKIGKYTANLWVMGVDRSALGNLKLEQGEYFASGSGNLELVVSTYDLMNFQDPNNWVDYYSEFSQWDPYTGQERSEEEMAELRKRTPGPEVNWFDSLINVTYGYVWEPEPGYEDVEIDNDMPAGKKYKASVVGIIDRDSYEYQTYIDLDMAQKMVRDNRKLAENNGIIDGKYNTVRIVAEDVKDVEQIMQKVRDMGYQPNNNLEYIKEWQDGVRRQQSQLLMIAAISLVVSAIGIANTMLTTIMERRSEIGVMKVVGMKIRSINMLFLTEATIIGMVGGLAGTAISYLFVFILNNSMGSGSDILGITLGENAQLGIPIWLIGVAVGIAMLTGLISGLYPSWKATKMSPLEAIRST